MSRGTATLQHRRSYRHVVVTCTLSHTSCRTTCECWLPVARAHLLLTTLRVQQLHEHNRFWKLQSAALHSIYQCFLRLLAIVPCVDFRPTCLSELATLLKIRVLASAARFSQWPARIATWSTIQNCTCSLWLPGCRHDAVHRHRTRRPLRAWHVPWIAGFHLGLAHARILGSYPPIG